MPWITLSRLGRLQQIFSYFKLFQGRTGPFADADPVLTVFAVRPSFLGPAPILLVEKQPSNGEKTSSIFSCPSFNEGSVGSLH